MANCSEPNVTVKFSRNPICPRITGGALVRPWGVSTPAMSAPWPSMGPQAGPGRTNRFRDVSSNRWSSRTTRPPRRIGSVCRRWRLPRLHRPTATTSCATTVSGPPVSISAAKLRLRPGTPTRNEARNTGRRSTSMRLTQVGIWKKPGVSQDRTRAARPARSTHDFCVQIESVYLGDQGIELPRPTLAQCHPYQRQPIVRPTRQGSVCGSCRQSTGFHVSSDAYK